MPHKPSKSIATDKDKDPIAKSTLRSLLKIIGGLNRNGMKAGNAGDFDKAFLNLEDALSLARDLDKKCLEAKLLNNLGILHTLNGRWDRAIFAYDQAMDIVTDAYGAQNFLYKTLQKNIGYLFNLDIYPLDTGQAA